MERVKPQLVHIVVTTNGRGKENLSQRLTFPNGTYKEGPVRIPTCEEGDELLYDLSCRANPVYKGTQAGWRNFLNGLLASRGQQFDFPE